MYCNKCGKEINDDAYICIGCGNLVGKNIEDTSIKSQQNKSLLNFNINIFLYIAFICITTFFVFFGLGLIDLRIHVYISKYDSSISSSFPILPNYVPIGMMISSIASTIISIISLVFSFKKKTIIDHSIVALIISIGLLILGIFALYY